MIYDPSIQMTVWGDSFKTDSSQNTGSSVEEAERLGNAFQENEAGPSQKYDQEANKSSDKVVRRLAQNREAARKSRLKKKAYVQQLESSRVKLTQMEQELQRLRQQGLLLGVGSGDPNFGSAVNSGITAFEMEYAHWVEEHNKHISELRSGLQQHIADVELQILVENGLKQYDNLFQMKTIAAKSDVFYLMSGMWKTSVERFFMWIGGFRPSELLKVLVPQLDPLTEQQLDDVLSLQLSCQQAEDALSQGLDRLQQTLSDSLVSDPLGSSGVANYMGQMASAMGRLEALESFVNQADHLRHQTLQQMHRILTTRQAARGLLAIGDYFQRLRALSSLWSARPRE